MDEVLAWRHPKPIGAQGRCIGQTDLPIDPRKARRLAHRIRQAARRHGWPRIVHTSPLQRCAMVGRQLRRWGWRHHIDDSLMEMHFGAWDGKPWSSIPQAEVEAWCASFLHGRPGQGESLADVFARVEKGRPLQADRHIPRVYDANANAEINADLDAPVCAGQRHVKLVIAHAGWMQVARWLADGKSPPTEPAQWLRPPAYGECWRLPCVAHASG